MIAVQNPSPFAGGAMVFVDAYYDIRHSYNNKIAGFSISGFSGSQPATIQNIPEHQTGAVYNAGSGTFVLVDYAKESANPAIARPGGRVGEHFHHAEPAICICGKPGFACFDGH